MGNIRPILANLEFMTPEQREGVFIIARIAPECGWNFPTLKELEVGLEKRRLANKEEHKKAITEQATAHGH